MALRRTLTWGLFGLSILFVLSLPPTAGEPPLSEESQVFRGDALHVNDFCFPFPGCQALQKGSPSNLKVLGLIIDTSDYRYTGNQGDLTAYADAKQVLFETNTNAYWLETSYGMVGTDFLIPHRVISMPGIFDDYYYGSFEQTELLTKDLTLPLDGSASAEIHVRDAKGRNRFVTLAPTGADKFEVADSCQEIFDAVPDTPSNWVECTGWLGDAIAIRLVDAEVASGTFIRPTGNGSDLSALGVDGPIESPGDDMNPPQLTAEPAPGGFPVTLTGGPGTVSIEVRSADKYSRTRTYEIPYPNDSYATPQDLVEQWLLPELNQEFDWIEYLDVGADRIGLQMRPLFVGDYARNSSIRIVGGIDLEQLGLDGPTRVDGVITVDKSRTLLGNREDFVGDVLSLYLNRRAVEEGIDITGANTPQLDALVAEELGDIDSVLVFFIDEDIGGTLPSSRRAGAQSSAEFDIVFENEDGSFGYKVQVDGGLMIGLGYTSWQTWAHELGHNLAFIDLYAKSHHDVPSATSDYVNDWGLMDSQSLEPHVSAWHKLRKGNWLPQGMIQDIEPPTLGNTDFYPFTLLPLEYPAADYAGVGSPQWPEKQLLRLKLSEHHWILIENRQPGDNYSLQLPDDLVGSAPPDMSGEVGGLLVSDTCDTNLEFPCLFRPAVWVMNPHGNDDARGIGAGETWSLDHNNAAPGYDGIVVRDMGNVPGPPGKPEARQVEIEWGPGDFLELEMRPWEAPDTYGTHDIWIDWPGNGEEDYSNSDPPLGQGDNVHWHPDGTVENLVKVRVHNRGTVDAQNVRIRWFLKSPGGAGSNASFVPQDDSSPQNIPAESFTDFTFSWKPTDGVHSCIKVQLLSYDSQLGDIDLTNNETNENIFNFDVPADQGAAATANGPVLPVYEPLEFGFFVKSNLPVPADVHMDVAGLVPGVDMELEQDQIRLFPEEEIALRARITVDAALVPPEFTSRQIKINVHSLLETPDAQEPYGGFTIDLRPRYRSSLAFVDSSCFTPDAGVALLNLTGKLGGQMNFGGQTIDVALVGSDGKDRGTTTLTENDGTFTAVIEDVPDGTATAMIYYWGPLMTSAVLGPITLDIDCGPRPPRPIPPTLTLDIDRADNIVLEYDETTCISEDHVVVMGTLGRYELATDAVCSIGATGEAGVAMPTDSTWFLIGGVGRTTFSSLGSSSVGERAVSGVESLCTVLDSQDSTSTCE
ncbi:hypothetical protein N9971_00130 [bacterium]|nr:hypothetical protein [bacterium]